MRVGRKLFSFLSPFSIGLIPSLSLGCACGCGVFDVGTSSMFPMSAGGMAFIEYDYMDQSQNYSLSSAAAAANNPDKEIRTHFLTVGGQYMFNRSWGVELQVPYWFRHFTTTDNNGNITSFDHSAIGDVRLKGIYTGASEDMSTGLVYGLKLPTGDNSYPNF